MPEAVNNKQSYLAGEFNAVQACGTAITEASSAIKAKFRTLPPKQKEFILMEFAGIMLRTSMLIREKNEKVKFGDVDKSETINESEIN